MSRAGHELDCERAVDAAAYVLGALDDPEARSYRAHLAECPRCRADVAQLQVAVDSLAVAVSPTSPAGDLRTRIMAPVHAEAEPLRAAGQRARHRAADSLAPRRTGRWLRLVVVLATALALGVGLVIGALVINTGSSASTEVIPAIVVAPGHHASAALRKVGSHLELVVVGMPAPPPGRIYEMWLERGTLAPEPTDVLFSVTRTGSGLVGVPSLRGADKVLVTDEPLGGSLKPTRTPVIVARV